MYSEYMKDMPELGRLAERFSRSAYIKRMERKNRNKKSFHATHKFYLNCGKGFGNTYHSIFRFVHSVPPYYPLRQSEWDWVSLIHIGIVPTHKGTCPTLFYSAAGAAVMFTPHFFKRYRERMMDFTSWPEYSEFYSCKDTESLACLFVKRNADIVWINTDSVYGDIQHIFSPVKDGVALVQWDMKKDQLRANTFITFDMLNDDQTKMLNYAKIYTTYSEKDRNRHPKPDFACFSKIFSDDRNERS